MMKIEDGIIEPGSKVGIKIGFTKRKFDGYLYKKDDAIWISVIISKDPGKGNVRTLFDMIESIGYEIIVPTPSIRMAFICTLRNMVPATIEVDMEMGAVLCMVSRKMYKQLKGRYYDGN